MSSGVDDEGAKFSRGEEVTSDGAGFMGTMRGGGGRLSALEPGGPHLPHSPRDVRSLEKWN